MRGLIALLLSISILLSFSAKVYPKSMSRLLIAYRGDIGIHKVLVNKLISLLNKEKTGGWEIITIDLEHEINATMSFPEQRADLGVALGDSALNFLCEHAHIKKGIYLLISNPRIIERVNRENIWSGTTLWVPLATQLSMIDEMYSFVKRIGIVVAKDTFQRIEKELYHMKSRKRIVPEIVTIDDPKEFIEVIYPLFQKTDMFLFYPDPLIFNSATIGEILKLQKEFMVPVLAPAPSLEEMGACIAIFYDLDELIKAIARHILHTPFKAFSKRYGIKIYINVNVTKVIEAEWILSPKGEKDKISFIEH